MGNQQLLIIVIAVVIISIAIAVGVTLFRDSAASSNRDQLVADLAQYGVRAQAYYRRPSAFGGGQSSFNGLTMDKITARASNINGTYTMDPDPVAGTPLSIKLIGIGTETGLNGTSPVKAVMVVFSDSMSVDETVGN
jgi:type II secretory pathway pseudopilin PulG